MNRNKELTKLKLIDAVGEIILEEGYTGLGINKIAKKADVDKVLIYRYFGSVDDLIETYIMGKDYWAGTAKKIHDVITPTDQVHFRDLVNYFLEKQFDVIFQKPELQKLMLWSISENNPLMEKLVKTREEVGHELFEVADQTFKDSSINFRAISAINVAALYYLALYGASKNGTFCEIDLGSPEERKEIIESMKMINQWAFEKAEEERSKFDKKKA